MCLSRERDDLPLPPDATDSGVSGIRRSSDGELHFKTVKRVSYVLLGFSGRPLSYLASYTIQL